MGTQDSTPGAHSCVIADGVKPSLTVRLLSSWLLPPASFLRRLLTGQNIARFGGAGWIDSHGPFVDMTNDAFLIDHESRSIAKALLLIENSIVLYDSSFEVA